jgi:hypothetical protein
MDREAAKLTVKLVDEELSGALLNRRAKAAIAVVSSVDNKLMNGQPLVAMSSNKWAVVLDKEQPNPYALKIAYFLARQIAIAANDQKSPVDFGELKKGVDEISGKLQLLDDLRVQLNNVAKSRDEAVALLDRYQRDVAATAARLLGSLTARTLASEGGS